MIPGPGGLCCPAPADVAVCVVCWNRVNRTCSTASCPPTRRRNRSTTSVPSRSLKVTEESLQKKVKYAAHNSGKCSVFKDLLRGSRCVGRLQRNHLCLRTDVVWEDTHHGGTMTSSLLFRPAGLNSGFQSDERNRRRVKVTSVNESRVQKL